MNTIQTIKVLKAVGEDAEWYPSTDEIIDSVAADIKKRRNDEYYDRSTGNLLDIGAGDGRVLIRLRDQLAKEHCIDDLFAIEKATTHLSRMPKEIIVIGTDFIEQTLVDKKVQYAFCNPPYSEYEQWMLKIVRECSAECIYLVVPRRWRESKAIQHALETRGSKVKLIGEFDFENAERRARAKVEVLRLTANRNKSSTFDAILEEMLPELEAFGRDEDLEDIPEDNLKACQLAESEEGLIPAMVKGYDKAVHDMIETYRSAVKVDVRILAELGVSKEGILKGIRQKITGLKNTYWQALFDRFGDITKRLATKQRTAFLESLKGKAAIDFTEGNILAMLVWVTKWANDYFDDQLTELFRTLSEDCNIERYKSNEKTWGKAKWRYCWDREGRDCYKLEYRIVVCHGGICTSGWSYEREKCRGLDQRAYDLIMDCITVANNLGFACSDTPANYQWKSNKQVKFHLDNGETLMAVRAFKNGNLHIHFNQKVILAINVEAGRLLGWLKSPQEAVDELQVKGEDAKFVLNAFGKHFRIAPNTMGLLSDQRTSRSA